MSLIRRLDTPENRAYWASVDEAAYQVRSNLYYHMACPKPGCRYSDSDETCEQVVTRHKAMKEPQAVNAGATPSDQGAPESAQSSSSSSPAIAPSERIAYHEIPRDQDGPIRIALEMRGAARDRTKDGATRAALAGWADRLSEWFSNSAGSGETAPAWQPLASAPTSEYDEVLAAHPGTGTEPEFLAFAHWEDGEWRDRGGHVIYPTHWMPLPSPPSGGPR